MNTDVLKEFLGKNVELTTNNKTYEGTLSRDIFHGTLTVTPTNKYTAKRFGPVVIDQNAVVSIRTVLPREEVKYDSQGEDTCEDTCEEKQIDGLLPSQNTRTGYLLGGGDEKESTG